MYFTPVFAARFEKHNKRETDPRAKKKFSDFLLLFFNTYILLFYVGFFVYFCIQKKNIFYNYTIALSIVYNS